MIWDLGTGWMVMAVTVVGIVSYILSIGLDGIMRRDGFGAGGNATIITVGFFASIYAVNSYGIRLKDFAEGAMVGLAGAFVCFTLIILSKALANRI